VKPERPIFEGRCVDGTVSINWPIGPPCGGREASMDPDTYLLNILKMKKSVWDGSGDTRVDGWSEKWSSLTFALAEAWRFHST
jgi:hypothetical protein